MYNQTSFGNYRGPILWYSHTISTMVQSTLYVSILYILKRTIHGKTEEYVKKLGNCGSSSSSGAADSEMGTIWKSAPWWVSFSHSFLGNLRCRTHVLHTQKLWIVGAHWRIGCPCTFASRLVVG